MAISAKGPDLQFVVRFQEPHVNSDVMQWPSSVRREPGFTPQLYFFQVKPINHQFNILVCSQAIADAKCENSVRRFNFLKRKYRIEIDPKRKTTATYNRYVIDEIEKKLYLLSGKGLLPVIDIKLKVFDLHFDPPDKLGYRRIAVAERPNTQFKVVMTDGPILLSNITFAISPINGQLFTYHFSEWHLQKRFQKRVCAPVALASPKQGEGSVACILSQDSFVTISADRELLTQRFHFSRLGDLLVFCNCCPRRDDNDMPVCLSKSNKYVFVLAYNSEIELVHKVKIDPMHFVRKYFPGYVYSEMISTKTPAGSNKHALFGLALDFLGHIYKYVVFGFMKCYILCVKWPKDWYTLDKLPETLVEHFFVVSSLHNDHQVEAGGLPTYVVGTKIYIKFYKPNSTVEELWVLNVGPTLKDYRKCANCNKIEDKKRRNKQGQRIAKFKVCRKCKSLNLHLSHTDPNLMCHYCSDQCQRLHWKIHKIIHKRPAMNREKSTAPMRL